MTNHPVKEEHRWICLGRPGQGTESWPPPESAQPHQVSNQPGSSHSIFIHGEKTPTPSCILLPSARKSSSAVTADVSSVPRTAEHRQPKLNWKYGGVRGDQSYSSLLFGSALRKRSNPAETRGEGMRTELSGPR